MRKYWSFKKSRVKTISTSVKTQEERETVRKRELFYCKPKKICTKKLKQFKETNSKGQKTDAESSSEQEHKVNALASGAEEGRDKLR